MVGSVYSISCFLWLKPALSPNIPCSTSKPICISVDRRILCSMLATQYMLSTKVNTGAVLVRVQFWAALALVSGLAGRQCGACSPQISAGVSTINGLALLPTEMRPGQTNKQKLNVCFLLFPTNDLKELGPSGLLPTRTKLSLTRRYVTLEG